MEHFKDIQLPGQMYPELAYHLARLLVWDNSDDREVDFVALCLLRTSWDFKEPEAIPGVLSRLHRLFKEKEPEGILKVLGDETHFAEKAKTYGVGAMTLHHVKRALRASVPHVPVESVPQYVESTVQALIAAVSDKSARGITLARTATQAIVSLMPTEEELSEAGDRLESTPEGGVMVVTPAGPFGPFADMRVALAWRQRAMAAHAQGLPLPEVPPMPVKAPATGESTSPALGPRAPVYTPAEALQLLQRMPPPTMPGEGNSQQRSMLERMVQGDGCRPLTVVSNLSSLNEMYGRFPHFKEVLDFVRRRLKLAGCGEVAGLVRLPPILLRGVEGTGKSYFSKQLARALGAHFVTRDVAATSATFVLSGMDSSWKGSKPGIVFDALVSGPTANPVICLNEIDKAKSTGTQGSPMEALYTLFEPEDSQAFKDEFIPIPIDASQVIWICTANEGEIPGPILQRLETFDIKAPTREECRIIAASVWSNLCTTVLPRGHGFPAEFSEPLLEVVSAVPPRVLRKTLEDAASFAIEKGNRFLTPEDVTVAAKRQASPAKRGIGF